MAQSVTKITDLRTEIQSKAQSAINELKKKESTTTEATKAGSTETPKTSETPKVTQTAKAMPSIQRPEITPVNIATPTITTPSSTDLFSKPTASIRKAITPDIIDDNNVDTPEAADILAKSYDNVPDSTKEFVGDLIRDNGIKILKRIYGNAIQENKATRTVNNLFSSAAIDTARGLINTAQGYLNKASFSLLPESSTLMNMTLPFYSFYRDSLEEGIMNTKLGQETKAERDKIFKAIFDTTEERDQKLAQTTGYKEAKKTADKWAEQGNTILDAMQEGNWDIVATRVGETIGQMLPIVGTALLTKNPGITASTTYTLIFGDAYKRSLVEINNNPEFDGLTAEQKNNLATTMAQIEAGIETMGDVLELAPFMKGKFSIADMVGLKNVILRGFLNIEGSAVIEGGEEVFTEILQNIAKRAYGGSDSATAQELGELFADTWAIMQFVGLLGGIKGGINTYNRNKVKKVLEKEAENYDNFNDFESDATRAGIDKELIQEAWSDSKGLSAEQTASLEYDIDYVENQENKATELYNEQGTIESRLEELIKTPEENKEQISKLEKRLQEINSQLQDIDNNIKEYMEVYGQQETTEELPSQQETQLPREEGGENLSEQTMANIDQSKTSQGEWNISESKESFDKSINQIKNGTKYYNTHFAKNYAYATSGKYIVGDTKQNQQMINKVQKLLKGIGINIKFKSMKGTRGLYNSGIVYYKKGNKELTLYGHEVFHAMMDVINNGELDDKQLQSELQEILRDAIEEVKKQFGIDGYKSGEELRYANKFAEEWIANAFGEYLSNREINGPKTFVQKIIAFFNKILDLFNSNKEKDLNSKLKYAFDKIASGEVTGKRGIPKMVSTYSASPIEESTEITQEELKNTEGYTESQEEDKLQSKQQEELGEHGEEIMNAGKESERENEIYNMAMDVELSEDVVSGKARTTPQTIKNIFGKDKNKVLKGLSILKTEAVQAYHDVMTSAKTRVLNIAPRIGGRIVQMEAQRDIYTHRYREKAKPFVEQISKLDDKAKFEIKKALLDYGALASEQGDNIEQYKQEEIAKLKEVLNKYGISEQATNDMFAMLAELGQRYKDAGLSVKLSDVYFPRTVTDYEGLRNYISEKTGIPQEEKNTLLRRIEEITRDPRLSDEEKEKKIRHLMTTDYHEPGKTSKNAKERKMGLLSEWGEGIYEFYGDPVEALDNYIVSMEDAIQKQLFLGGLQEEAGLKDENVSVGEIIESLVAQGKISNEDLEELKKSILSILNKKPTPKSVAAAKSVIHVGLLANFISAVTQFDDLGVVILQDRTGLKNIVKAFFGKAGIKYSDLGLENSYEIFKDQFNITNWFFAKSFFNAIDRLGKTSFINTAWESLKRQAKKNKDGTDTRTRKNLIKRLTDMYGEETAAHIMEKIDSGDYMTNGQPDIDVLTDLSYLLSDTQPIYTSDMPTAYLNNGWIRICYSLQTFTIKRINMLLQGTKDVYKNNGGGTVGAVRAGVWLMYTTAFLAMWGALVGDAQDYLKGDKEDTALYKLITEGIDAMLEQLWKDSKGSWLKIWNLSDYDKKIYSRQGAWGWLMSKMEPPIIGMGYDLFEAITEHNKDEITDLAKYTPIIGKLLYYWFWDELQSDMKKSKNGLIRRDDSGLTRRDEEEGLVRRSESGLIRRD